MIKIAILTSRFPPELLGGTEIASYHIAKKLAIRGHEVHVITQMNPNLLLEDFEGFYVHRVAIPNLKLGGLTFFTFSSCFILEKIRPHIIHAQSIPMGLPCLIIKKLLKIPFVVCGQGSDVYGDWPHKSLVSRNVLKNADAVIALSGDMKRRMLKICNREIFIIPNGVEAKTFSSITKDEARKKLGMHTDEKIVLFAGRLHPVKGLEYLIKAMNVIRSCENDVKLIIVGNGEQRDYLLRLAKKLNLEKYVIFTGKVPHRKVPIYLSASDIFVLPSLSEGFPLIIVEAMASGLPIVATKVGAMPEIINDHENGFLIEPMNHQQIAEKCLLILKDEKLRREISANNLEKAKEYSWEKIVQSLETLYLTLLKTR